MKTSAWLAWPVLAISTSALLITPATDPSNDIAAVAGSTAPISVSELFNSTKSLLELEYESLEALKYRLHELHHEVLRKERDILHIINHDFRSCSGVKCYLQTALKKAPDFYELFKTHFRHSAKNATGCPWSTNSSSIPTDAILVPPQGRLDHDDGSPLPSPFEFDGPPPSSPPPPPPSPPAPFEFEEEYEVIEPSEFGDSYPLSPPPPPPPHPAAFDVHDDEPGYHVSGHHGPPPPDDPHDTHTLNDVAPAYHGHKPHHERPPFHMPHPAPRPRHFNLILATGGLVISILIFAALFKGLRMYCANPRVRAERAARIEECRTKREYRRAACQHRLRQVLSRFRRRSRTLSTDDYEEKRAMLRTVAATAPTANAEDHIVGSNIASLRRAHELVGQLMLAEEGRSHAFSFAATQGQPQAESHLHSSSRSVHSINTTTTLPAYVPPPPRYSQELAREARDVVDGFRYTPTHSGHTPSSSSSPSTFMLDNENDREMENDIDAVTESSVVDCLSRMSMATETEAEAEIMRGRVRGMGREKEDFQLAGDRYIGRFD